MKQLRLLMAAFAAVFSLCASAQGWKGNVVADGTFYLYNIGSGQWLCGGNDWGTHASVNDTGDIDFILTASGDGYTIDSQITNGGDNHFLGTNSYVDSGAYPWTFTQASRTDGVVAYYISCTVSVQQDDQLVEQTQYLVKDEGTYANVKAIEGQPGDEGQWVLVTLAERMEVLKGATEANPVNATFLLKDASFGRNDTRASGWTMEAGNQNFGAPGTGKANNFGCAESWQSAFTMTQKATVPNGIYKVTAQACLTDYTEAYDGTDYPVIFVGEATAPFKNMEGSDIGSNMETLSKSFAAGNYVIGPLDATVVDGTITLGAKGTRTNTWCIWDNFQLVYYGDLQDLAPFVEAYEKALATAKELLTTTETIGKNPLASLRGATILYGEARVDKTSKESLETATAALNAAIEAANKSIASYKVIASGVIATDNVAGWTCTNTQAFHVNTWSTEADNTGMVTPFIENWCDRSGVLGDGEVYYTLEGLNPGEIYYAQALVRVYSESGNEPNGPIFFINSDETNMTEAGKSFTYNNMLGYYGTLGGLATVGSDGTLKLGVKISEANYNWVAFKNVTISTMEKALQASVDKVEAFYGKIPTAVEEPTKNFVETTKASVSDNETLQAAIQGLNAKAEELAPIATAFAAAQNANNYSSKYYDEVKALCEVKDYKELAEGAHDKLQATVEAAKFPVADKDALNALTTAEAINDYANDLKAQVAAIDETLRAAGIEYNNNAEPVGDAIFPISFVITNGNLEGLPTWNKCEGWNSERTTGNSQVMVNNDVTSEDGTKTAFYEYWSEAPAADGTFALFNTINLPAGNYTANCYAFAAQPTGGEDCNVKFYANDTEGQAIASTRLAPATIDFELAEAGDVKLGLKALEGNFYRWMGIGYLELCRKAVPEPEDPNWQELVINGDVEGEDGTSLVTKNGGADGSFSFNPVEGAGIGGSKAAVVHVAEGAAKDWDAQFFIYEPSHVFAEGEKYKVSFRIKADKPAQVDLQAHTTPGNYIGFYVDGFSSPFDVTTEWQTITFEGTVTDHPDWGATMSGMQTLAFNLSKDKTQENNFYFDNISWKLYAEPTEPEKDLLLTEDNTEVPAAGIYKTVTVQRNFKKGFNTIVLPFDYTIADIKADKVLRYVGATTLDANAGYTINFSRVSDEETLKANVPYAIYNAEAVEVNTVFENVTIAEADELTVAGGDFDFVGSYVAYADGESPVVEGDYIFGEKSLQKAKGGNQHKALRAYLKSNVGKVAAPLFIKVDGAEVDGIRTIEVAGNTSDRIYNLNGQLVSGAQKGIYIINGKKVVRK